MLAKNRHATEEVEKSRRVVEKAGCNSQMSCIDNSSQGTYSLSWMLNGGAMAVKNKHDIGTRQVFLLDKAKIRPARFSLLDPVIVSSIGGLRKSVALNSNSKPAARSSFTNSLIVFSTMLYPICKK